MKIITIAIIALLSACVAEPAAECTDLACMAETSASFEVSAEVLAQLTPVGDGPIVNGCPYSPEGPIGCCYTIGSQQCCCIPRANGTFQCQCTTIIVVSPNNPPAPPLAPEPEPDADVEALQQAAQDAYDAIPPEIMAQFSPTGSGPITNDCGIHVDDGDLSCCYRQAGVNCCCIFGHTCGCERIISSPNNPPSAPGAPDPETQVDYTEPTDESMAVFALAPTDGQTQDGCYIVITGDDRGLLQCCHTIGNSRCCTWSVNGGGFIRQRCEQTGPISPNNPPSAP